VTRGATVGYDRHAHEDATSIVKEFLRRQWKLNP
jgi:hypothetical protein